MANIEHVNVAGQVYDIRVPDGSSLSLASLTVTGNLTCAEIDCSGDASVRWVTAETLTVNSVSVRGSLTATTLTVTGNSNLSVVNIN